MQDLFIPFFFFGEAKEKVVGLERKNSDGNVLSLGDVVVEVEDEKIGDRLEEGGRGVLNRTANGPFCHQGNDHYTHTHTGRRPLRHAAFVSPLRWIVLYYQEKGGNGVPFSAGVGLFFLISNQLYSSKSVCVTKKKKTTFCGRLISAKLAIPFLWQI